MEENDDAIIDSFSLAPISDPVLGPLPGRPRRRNDQKESKTKSDKKEATSGTQKRRRKRYPKRQASNFLVSFFFPSSHKKKKIKKKVNDLDVLDSKMAKAPKKASENSISMFLAVFLWYTLGVLSVSTSKILLTSHPSTAEVSFLTVGGVGPLLLSVQQFGLGAFMLFCLLRYEDIKGGYKISETHSIKNLPKAQSRGEGNVALTELFLSGFFFSFGFVLTNYSFHGNDASFVETIKASEPISSAAVASMNSIEVLGYEEILSLLVIVFGVVLSTIAKSSPQVNSSSANSSFWSSLFSCILVSSSNLCFSFRGLHQKLFRKSYSSAFDDMNLQFRMQQTGAGLFLLPAIIFEFPAAFRKVLLLFNTFGLFQSGIFARYTCLAFINAFAFVSYNLASTYILSRITVVQHAALNALRRVFAVFMTSIIFSVPITLLGFIGIALSILGFFFFTHFKMKRKQSPRVANTVLPMTT